MKNKKVLGNDPFERINLAETGKDVASRTPTESIDSVSSEKDGTDVNGIDTTTIKNLEASIERRMHQFEESIDKRFRSIEKRLDETLNKLTEREERVSFEEINKLLESYQKRFEKAMSLIEPTKKGDEVPQIKDIIKVFENLKTAFDVNSYKKLWRSISMVITSDVVDEFGFDPVFEDAVKPLFDFLYRRWWRVEAIDIKNVPISGRALIVSNHSGTLPFDGAMIKYALLVEHPAHREGRPLIENFVYFFPFLGNFLARTGGIRADQDNARRLLEKDQVVMVFPEGIKGIGKLYKDRYKLQRFGRGGFIKLALKTKAPIVPVSVVGAEEIYPMIMKLERMGKMFGFPYIPVTPTFPFLGPLGIIPLPSKWFIKFGKPINMEEYPEDAADDDLLINNLSEMVRATIQEMIYEVLKKRRSIWFG